MKKQISFMLLTTLTAILANGQGKVDKFETDCDSIYKNNGYKMFNYVIRMGLQEVKK